MTERISVPWEIVTDGKSRQGSMLPHYMRGLLDAGYGLNVQTPEGTKTFTDSGEFGAWFDALGTPAGTP